ncbi:MAG: hypothetical protein M3O20_01975 [Acidobacteriota bacterium]|nr:hypothetical protein [Acidobacteriota bacterium]
MIAEFTENEIAQEREPYIPVLSPEERRAYAAAHRIVAMTDSGEWELCCPGGIRSRRIDRVAAMIMEEFSR